MSSTTNPAITVKVDVTNPGQFFACCGLLELAGKLWPGAEGWFMDGSFHLHVKGTAEVTLKSLFDTLKGSSLESADTQMDAKIAPINMKAFSFRLDWWLDDQAGINRLKTWAGKQGALRIAEEMKKALPEASDGLLNASANTSAPFYFDSRRFAHPMDAGFSLDAVGMNAASHPAVELLALIGLQRFRPAPGPERWSFAYSTWKDPLPTAVACAVCAGAVLGQATYVFPVGFRDDRKRFKAFTRATLKPQLP